MKILIQKRNQAGERPSARGFGPHLLNHYEFVGWHEEGGYRSLTVVVVLVEVSVLVRMIWKNSY